MNGVKRLFVLFVQRFWKSEIFLKWIIKKKILLEQSEFTQLWKMNVLTKLNLSLGKLGDDAKKERLHFWENRKSVWSGRFYSKGIRIAGDSDLEESFGKKKS